MLVNEIIEKLYDKAFLIEMSVEESAPVDTGFLLSKFGQSWGGDTVKLNVSKNRFNEEVPNEFLVKSDQPNVGDLIYIDFQKQFYEITYIATADPFRGMGVEFSYTLSLTPYQFSHETFGKLDIKETDGTDVIDAFLKKMETEDQDAPTSDSTDITTDNSHFTVDNTDPGFIENITIDNTSIFVSDEIYIIEDYIHNMNDDPSKQLNHIGYSNNEILYEEAQENLGEIVDWSKLGIG